MAGMLATGQSGEPKKQPLRPLSSGRMSTFAPSATDGGGMRSYDATTFCPVCGSSTLICPSWVMNRRLPSPVNCADSGVPTTGVRQRNWPCSLNEFMAPFSPT